MKYMSRHVVKLGDIIRIGSDQQNIVVGIIDEKKYLPGYNKEDWQFLEHGLLVFNRNFGVLRMEAPDEDTFLIRRSPDQEPNQIEVKATPRSRYNNM